MNSAPAHPSTPVLSGNAVQLRPMRTDHAQALIEAAGDGELWNLKVTVVPGPETVQAYIAKAIEGERAGTVMPFVIVDRAKDRIVGSTRFWKIDHANRKLEIGHTWLAASAQRSSVNTEAKYLMLAYAFETLNSVRVQFTTDELNEKSRAAILRILFLEVGHDALGTVNRPVREGLLVGPAHERRHLVVLACDGESWSCHWLAPFAGGTRNPCGRHPVRAADPL